MNLYFYIPYLYTIKTRLGKKGRFLSYFLILVIPPAYFALLQQSETGIKELVYVLLGLLYVQNLYEIGYIQNDTETIKKEVHPTLRLSIEERNYYEQRKLRIYGFRAFQALSIGLILLIISNLNPNIRLFLIVSSLITPIYLTYNSLRNIWNLILNFLLTILKYSTFQLLFFDSFQIRIFILSILTFPVMNLLERAATPRFFKQYSIFFIPNLSIIRMWYYFSLLCICFVLWCMNYLNLMALIPVAFYFVYRSAIVITNKK